MLAFGILDEWKIHQNSSMHETARGYFLRNAFGDIRRPGGY